MSFFKKLFGGGNSGSDASPKTLDELEHNGFLIKAIEMRVGGEFQLCGEISKEINGELKTHKFIRADRLSSADQAASVTLTKGQQIVGEQGDAVFG